MTDAKTAASLVLMSRWLSNCCSSSWMRGPRFSVALDALVVGMVADNVIEFVGRERMCALHSLAPLSRGMRRHGRLPAPEALSALRCCLYGLVKPVCKRTSALITNRGESESPR